jgi:hypothetical protein
MYIRSPNTPDLFTQKMVTAFLAETSVDLSAVVWPTVKGSVLALALFPPALHLKMVCIQNNFPHMPVFIKDSNFECISALTDVT